VTTVYNLRVAEYHTYFVGSRGWAFSLWAHNAYAKPNLNTLWSVVGANKKAYHGKFGMFYHDPLTGLWWSKDTAGHGGSAWKVFQEGKKGLTWIADADGFGNYIVGKHKGPIGKFIPWGQLVKG
jgi:hypothetical protein